MYFRMLILLSIPATFAEEFLYPSFHIADSFLDGFEIFVSIGSGHTGKGKIAVHAICLDRKPGCEDKTDFFEFPARDGKLSISELKVATWYAVCYEFTAVDTQRYTISGGSCDAERTKGTDGEAAGAPIDPPDAWIENGQLVVEVTVNADFQMNVSMSVDHKSKSAIANGKGMVFKFGNISDPSRKHDVCWSWSPVGISSPMRFSPDPGIIDIRHKSCMLTKFYAKNPRTSDDPATLPAGGAANRPTARGLETTTNPTNSSSASAAYGATSFYYLCLIVVWFC